MKAIGGYIELETGSGLHFYEDLLKFNTAKSALLFLLKSKKINKILVSKYNCTPFINGLIRGGIKVDYYDIDDNLEPVEIREDLPFLYTNFFGIKNDFIKSLHSKNIIIDNAQSFFSPPVNGLDTIYSPRKFFGVPDGGYLYSKEVNSHDLKPYVSHNRCSHLLKRLECSPESGYRDYMVNEENLISQPVMDMSTISKRILSSINYNDVHKKRINNFNFLNDSLSNINALKFSNYLTPVSYPLRLTSEESERVRNFLIDSKIFVTTYWPKNNYKSFSKDILHLPIDHRYDLRDMSRIVNLISGLR